MPIGGFTRIHVFGLGRSASTIASWCAKPLVGSRNELLRVGVVTQQVIPTTMNAISLGPLIPGRRKEGNADKKVHAPLKTVGYSAHFGKKVKMGIVSKLSVTQYVMQMSLHQTNYPMKMPTLCADDPRSMERRTSY